MIRFRSLALTTELPLWLSRGLVEKRPGYWVVRTATAPSYFFGNLLLLPEAPRRAELAMWQARFVSEFPQAEHVALWWDRGILDEGTLREFADRGFSVDELGVLVMDLEPGVFAPPSTIRSATANDWQALYDVGWAISDRKDSTYHEFLLGRCRWQAQLISRGLAAFCIVFDGEQPIASAGVSLQGDTIRFQDVQTIAEYRKRGAATTMIRYLLQIGANTGAKRAVIIAERFGTAYRLYHQLGFVETETTQNVCRISGAK